MWVAMCCSAVERPWLLKIGDPGTSGGIRKPLLTKGGLELGAFQNSLALVGCHPSEWMRGRG